MAGYQQMLQQVQKMQREYQKQQDVLDKTEFEYVANGAVKVVLKGDMELVSIEFLDKDIIDKEDPEMLADLIKLAYKGARDLVNDANDKLASKFQSLTTGGLF